MANYSIKFKHVSSLPTGLTTDNTGEIYFNSTAGSISVWNGTAFEDYGAGGVRNATFSNNVLTLTLASGSPVVLDFSDVASATNVNTLLGGLRGDVDNLQSATGIADGASAPAWSTDGSDGLQAAETLVEGIEVVDAAVAGEAARATAAEGTLTNLTTSAKGNLVSAINEVNAAAVANADNITDLQGDVAILNGADTVEGSVAKALKDAKAYTDGKKLAGTIAANSSNETNFVTAKQVSDFASGVTGAMHFIGVASTNDVEMGVSTTVVLGGVTCYIAKENYEAASGDVILVGTKEYVYSGSETGWQLFGDEGAYATAANLEAEISRATTAEGLLDGRLDVLEGEDTVNGSVKKALKDAKDYTDGRIGTLGNVSGTETAHTVKSYVDAAVDAAETAIEGLDQRLDILEGTGASSVSGQITTAISGLTATVDNSEDATGAGDVASTQIMVEVVETSGKLTGVSVYAPSFEAEGAAAAVKSEVIGTSSDASSADTIYGAKKYADAAASDAEDAAKAYADGLFVWDWA